LRGQLSRAWPDTPRGPKPPCPKALGPRWPNHTAERLPRQPGRSAKDRDHLWLAEELRWAAEDPLPRRGARAVGGPARRGGLQLAADESVAGAGDGPMRESR